MHVLLGKKQIVLAALVVALGLAVFVNWYYSDDGTKLFDPVLNREEETEEVKAPDSAAEFVNADAEYFAEIRMTRDAAHDAAMEELKAVMASAGNDADNMKAIEKLSRVIKMETDVESLINSKTGSECVAVISDDTVEVVIPSENLGDESVLKISDIVGQVCGKEYENIKISGTVS